MEFGELVIGTIFYLGLLCYWAWFSWQIWRYPEQAYLKRDWRFRRYSETSYIRIWRITSPFIWLVFIFMCVLTVIEWVKVL